MFIFLIDQSGSVSGLPIKIASKSLILFLQSLLAGSYYQIIGFVSTYKIYDTIPKEYNQKNILESIKILESLTLLYLWEEDSPYPINTVRQKGDSGGANIYTPLKHIYESSQNF